MRPTRFVPRSSLQLFATLFASQAALLTLSPLVTAMGGEFGRSTASIGQLRSLSGLCAGLVALWIASKRGPRADLRTMLLIGLVALAAGVVATAVAPGFAFLMAAQIPLGVGVALALSCGTAAAGRWPASGDNVRVLAWALAGQPVAWIVGLPLIGVVARSGWRWAWIAVPGTAAVIAFILVAIRPRPPEMHRPGGFRHLLGHPAARAWALSELLAYCGWSGTLVYSGSLFLESYDTSVTVTSLYLAGGAALYTAGNFISRRRMPDAPVRFLIATALACAVGVASFGIVRPSAPVSFLLFSATAVVAGGRTLAGGVYGLTLMPREPVGIMALRTACVQFGYLLGSLSGGIALASGGYGIVGATFAAFFLLAVPPLVGTIRNHRSASVEEPLPSV